MRNIIIIALLLVSSYGFAQSDDAPNPNLKLGVKTAINFSVLTGSELTNPTPRFGYSAGVYMRNKLNNKWWLQTEFLGNFKGSHFSNGDGEYQGISIFALDLPVLISYEITEGKSVLFGPQFSRIALSSMFLDNNAKPEKNGLNMHPFALDATIAYQSIGKIVGFQTALKLGLTNLNNGVHFDNISPATGKNGTIHSISFELALLF